MEPNKIEEIIKNKLESREIQPSGNAWDRLDAMLSVEEKPKQKVAYWKYIAASIVLFLGISFWYNQNSEVETIMESQPVNSVVEETVQKEENPILENKTEIADNTQHPTPNIQQNKNQIQNSKININQQPEIITEKPIANYQQPNIENSISTTNNKPQTINNKYISAEKLLASVENGATENISIQNENVAKPKKNSVKVNPDALLTSVETEINYEYRETTFDKLKRKFNETKTAVANRNYE